MHVGRGKARGLTYGVVIGELDVRRVLVPFRLALVDGDSQLRHGVIHVLRATVTLRAVGSWWTCVRLKMAAETLAQKCDPPSMKRVFMPPPSPP